MHEAERKCGWATELGGPMSGFLSASPTWKPGTPIERWPYQIPGSTARLAALQDKLRSWQRWPSVAEPSDPVALLDELPGFQLAWLSGVRDVPVLLGLVLSELAAAGSSGSTKRGACRQGLSP